MWRDLNSSWVVLRKLIDSDSKMNHPEKVSDDIDVDPWALSRNLVGGSNTRILA